MNYNGGMNRLLKTGLIANGVYLVVMYIQLIMLVLYAQFESGVIVRLTSSGGTNLTAVMWFLQAMDISMLLVVLPTQLYRMAGLFVHDIWPYYVITNLYLIIFIISIIGVKLIASGRARKGVLLSLIGSVVFFPLGIIGAIGAWQELKKSERPGAQSGADKKLAVRVVAQVLAGIGFLIFQGLAIQSLSRGNDRDAMLRVILMLAMAVLMVLPFKKRA